MTTPLTLQSTHACFGGEQRFYQHDSTETGLPAVVLVNEGVKTSDADAACAQSSPPTASTAESKLRFKDVFISGPFY